MSHGREADGVDDIILVGGGLANGLIALKLGMARPELAVHILEAGSAVGGRHTWSFFGTDLTLEQREWINPLVTHSWTGYTVRFPTTVRRLTTPYNSISSERLHDVVTGIPTVRVTLGADVTEVEQQSVSLADGRTFRAALVIDGRGPVAAPDLELGFQKFVGLEVELEQPHHLVEPIIMDACVEQAGGYRFLYVLPLDEYRLLIEDTRYTDTPEPDRDRLRQGAIDYARDRGWSIARVLNEEDGVLPVALDGDLEAHLDRLDPLAQVGLRAGLFHPTTGYSLPDAVRMADYLALIIRPGTTSGLRAQLRTWSVDLWKRRGFYRLLNRMLFRAAHPQERYKVLERFYRLPKSVIERFYAAEATFGDKARILSGKPPVSVRRAVPCLFEKGRA